jgi:glycerophosphoryl diester phosphodiesterase
MHQRTKRLLALVVFLVAAGLLVRSPLRTTIRWQLQGAMEVALATPFPAPADVAVPTRIAHAGGSLFGLSYTNSVEALERNFALGARWFEVDFARDGKGDWWAVHDWTEAHERLGVPLDAQGRGLPEQQPQGGPFELVRMERILGWLADHPDARLVTDTKDDNPPLLRRLAEAPAALRLRIHPQLYRIPEYPLARSGGFGAPIFTTYRSRYPWWAVARFARSQPLLAVTVTREEASDAAQALAGTVALLTHTINDASEEERWIRAGLAGIYTDDLLP